jgi:PhnB protein
MAITFNPYLSFNGNAREAMEFYHSVFGGNLEMTTFAEGGMPPEAGDGTKIMHAALQGNGITLMASDTPPGKDYRSGTTVSLSLSGEDEEVLASYFAKLSDGGQVHEPLVKAPWGDTFGMFADKFGFEWMVNITAPK